MRARVRACLVKNNEKLWELENRGVPLIYGNRCDMARGTVLAMNLMAIAAARNPKSLFSIARSINDAYVVCKIRANKTKIVAIAGPLRICENIAKYQLARFNVALLLI